MSDKGMENDSVGLESNSNFHPDSILGKSVSARKPRLSRRDFMKASAIVLASAGAAAFIDPENISIDEELKIEPIATMKAVFYPIFERHDQRRAYSTELAKLNVTPDVHFVELLVSNSAREFQEETQPSSLLFWNSVSLGGKKHPLLDAQTIVDFAHGKADVAYEGIVEPSFNFKGVVKTVGRNAVTFVASLLEGSSINFDESMKNKLWEIQTEMANANPEDLVVFFRNCLMARKLQTIAGYYAKILGRETKISFGVGFAHRGVADLLRAGEEATLALFDLFSDQSLDSIIKQNGGMEALCSTLIVPVDEVIIEKKDSKIVVTDFPLLKFLENKLAG